MPKTTVIGIFKLPQAMHMRAAAVPEIVGLRKLTIGLAYLVAYIALDWVSFIEPYAHLNITPWSPNTGLSFVLILLFGQRMIPFLFAGPFLADLINQHNALPWAAELASVVVIGGGYSAALFLLTRPSVRFDPTLSSMRDLVLLMLVAAASAAVVASSYVGLTIAAGLSPAGDFVTAMLRYWIGDLVGILAVAPFIIFVSTRRRVVPLSAESVLQCAAVIGALLLVFGVAEEREFQLFYVLFLPIIWMAVRNGVEGSSVGILIAQIGLILGLELVPDDREEMVAFQALMLVLAVTGLVAGQLVTERRRAEAQLRLHQESLARLTRLGSVGELAAAVAHEVNQPLMAAGTYARLVTEAIGGGQADPGEIAETAKKAVAQVDRAAEVIRRLRALVRLDRSNRTPMPFEKIVRQTIELCQPDLDRANVSVRVAVTAGLPPVLVDILQIEQVLLNLVRNSIDAIGGSGESYGSILVEAAVADDNFVEVRVADSGPGFSRAHIENGILPLSSSKRDGLGIGLPLCKSIVEAHGGRFWLRKNSPGASVSFTLPVAPTMDHG